MLAHIHVQRLTRRIRKLNAHVFTQATSQADMLSECHARSGTHPLPALACMAETLRLQRPLFLTDHSLCAQTISMPSWLCPFACGQTYQRSSTRSIRSHIYACFRQHKPALSCVSDKQLSDVICHLQNSGQLVTGLRRWKKRRTRRLAHELSDNDRWDCIWGCGKMYRVTSSRSVQHHANTCILRSDEQDGDVDVKRPRAPDKQKKQQHMCVESNSAPASSNLSIPLLGSTESTTALPSSNDDYPILPAPCPYFAPWHTPRTMSSEPFTSWTPAPSSPTIARPATLQQIHMTTTTANVQRYRRDPVAALESMTLDNRIFLELLFRCLNDSASNPVADIPLMHQSDEYIAGLASFLRSCQVSPMLLL